MRWLSLLSVPLPVPMLLPVLLSVLPIPSSPLPWVPLLPFPFPFPLPFPLLT